jgi:hypothetical protein
LARIGLTFAPQSENPASVLEPTGGTIDLSYFRFGTVVALGHQPRPLRDAWIDTGSYLTTIPQLFWDVPSLRGQIDWLQPAAGAPALPRLRLAGGSYGFRLGRIWMTALDLPAGQQLRSHVIAKFLLAPSPLRAVLIGLRHSLLDGRRLVLEPDSPLAYLEDR